MKTQFALLFVLPVLPWLVACSDDTGSTSMSSAGSAGIAAGGTIQQTGGATSGGAAGAMSGGAGAGGTGGAAGSTGVSAGMAGGGAAGMAGAGGALPTGPVMHHVMAIEYPGRLVEISADGQKLWEHQTPSLTVMFNVLPNGNVFYPHGGTAPGTARGAQEVDRNHNVVWNYDSPAGELLGGERLANGNSVLGEGGPPKAIELTPSKQLAGSVDVATNEMTAHGQIRHVHRLSNGNTLLALESDGFAREIDPTGKTVWEFGGVLKCHEALRLPNGNTLIGGGQSKRVIEVTPGGQIAWEFNEQDGPDLGLAWITSIQVLKNGDLLVGNWVGGEGGPGVHAFQVTRDKKVVWKLDDHVMLKSATTVTALDD